MGLLSTATIAWVLGATGGIVKKIVLGEAISLGKTKVKELYAGRADAKYPLGEEILKVMHKALQRSAKAVANEVHDSVIWDINKERLNGWLRKVEKISWNDFYRSITELEYSSELGNALFEEHTTVLDGLAVELQTGNYLAQVPEKEQQHFTELLIATYQEYFVQELTKDEVAQEKWRLLWLNGLKNNQEKTTRCACDHA